MTIPCKNAVFNLLILGKINKIIFSIKYEDHPPAFCWCGSQPAGGV